MVNTFLNRFLFVYHHKVVFSYMHTQLFLALHQRNSI